MVDGTVHCPYHSLCVCLSLTLILSINPSFSNSLSVFHSFCFCLSPSFLSTLSFALSPRFSLVFHYLCLSVCISVHLCLSHTLTNTFIPSSTTTNHNKHLLTHSLKYNHLKTISHILSFSHSRFQCTYLLTY